MKRLALLLLFSPLLLRADNWAARLFQTMAANEPAVIAGVPTNCVANWLSLGTNTSLAAVPNIAVRTNLVFVGDDSARDAFSSSRAGLFQNWFTNSWLPLQAQQASNDLAQAALDQLANHGPQFRFGRTNITVIMTNQICRFVSPLADNQYEIFLSANGIQTWLTPTNRTVNGFQVIPNPPTNAVITYLILRYPDF